MSQCLIIPSSLLSLSSQVYSTERHGGLHSVMFKKIRSIAGFIASEAKHLFNYAEQTTKFGSTSYVFRKTFDTPVCHHTELFKYEEDYIL
jgi:hypothetical protein